MTPEADIAVPNLLVPGKELKLCMLCYDTKICHLSFRGITCYDTKMCHSKLKGVNRLQQTADKMCHNSIIHINV